MAVITNFLCVGSAQYFDDIAHAKAFFCPCHAREEFLRINGAIFQNNLAQAVITVAAVFGWQYLAKVGQQGVATTGGAIAVGQNLPQLLIGEVLFVLTGFLGNNKLNLHTVTVIKEEDALSWQVITASTARLLVIPLEVARQVIVDDRAHVRLADTHTKGDGGHEYRHIVADETFLVLAPLLTGEARVVGQSADTVMGKGKTELIDALAALAVDDNGRLWLLTQELQQFAIGAFVLWANFVIDVGPIKTGDVYVGIAEFELGEDIVAHALGRGSSERQHWHLWIALAQLAQLTVFRTKIMPPLSDTVSLIDGQQRETNMLLDLVE